MIEVAAKVADLWLTRGGSSSQAAVDVRAAVAHLKPAVVITGGGRGIGAALANEFQRRGHHVAVVGRNAPDPSYTRRVLFIICDVRAPDAFEVIASRLAAEGCYLDVLVNNAAIGLSGPFVDAAAADLDALIATNMTAVTRLTRLALPDMRARRRGGILNVASLGGYAPGPHQATYYASKAFVLSLTEAIAVENAGHGVRFTVLAPGPVDTGFHAAIGADGSLYRRLLPALSPERVARAAYRGFSIGQRVVVPGIFNRVMLALLKIAPHPISAPIIGRLLRRP